MKKVVLVLVCFLLAIGMLVGAATAGEARAASEDATVEETDPRFSDEEAALDEIAIEALQAVPGCPFGSLICAPEASSISTVACV